MSSGTGRSGDPGESPRAAWRHAAIPVLAALVLSLPAVTFEFVWDDAFVIEGSPAVKGPFSLARILAAPINLSEGPTSFYRPVQLLTHALEYGAVGFVPWAYHLTNVLLYAANVLLVFLLGVRLGASRVGSTIGALLFAAMPVHAEVVGFVSSRGDLLAALFLLLAMLCAIEASRAGSPRRVQMASGGSGLFLLLALGSKEAVLLMPLALAVWPWLDEGGGAAGMRRPRRFVALALGCAAGTAAYLVVRALAFDGRMTEALGGLDVGGSFRRVFTYTRMLFDPTVLQVLYPLERPGWTWESIAGLLLLLLLVGVALVLRGKSPLLLFLLLWYVCALVPVSKPVVFGKVDMAVRYTFVGSAALAWLASLAFTRLAAGPSTRRRRLAVAAAVALLALGVAWGRELSSWRNEVVLFQRMVRELPAEASSHYNLASSLAAAGRRGEAIDHLRTAVQLDPFHASARYNLGLLLADERRTEEALIHLRHYLELRPGAADAEFTRGLIRYLEAARQVNSAPPPRSD